MDHYAYWERILAEKADREREESAPFDPPETRLDTAGLRRLDRAHLPSAVWQQLWPDPHRFWFVLPDGNKRWYRTLRANESTRLVLWDGRRAQAVTTIPTAYQGDVFAFRIPKRITVTEDRSTDVGGTGSGSSTDTLFSDDSDTEWPSHYTRPRYSDQPIDLGGYARMPMVAILQPPHEAVIDIMDPEFTERDFIYHTLVAGETLFSVAERYLGVPDIQPILNLEHNNRWRIAWHRQGDLPPVGTTLRIPYGRALTVRGNARHGSSVHYEIQGPTQEQGRFTINPNAPDGDNYFNIHLPVRVGRYNVSVRNGAEQDQRRFEVVGTLPEHELPIKDLCYLPGEGALLALTDELIHAIDEDATLFDGLMQQLADAETTTDRQGVPDAAAITAAKQAISDALRPLVDPRTGISALTEVIGYRGRKYTYVRRDKLRLIWQKHPLWVDILDARRFTDAAGRFDRDKALQAMKSEFALSNTRFDLGYLELYFRTTHLTAWAEQWNTGEHQGKDWLAASEHFSATTDSALMRYTQGASLKLIRQNGRLGLRGEGQANLELASGRTRLATHLPNKDGQLIQFQMQNRNQEAVEFSLGVFRFTTQVVLTGYAGAKASLAVNLEVNMNSGQAELRGLDDTEVNAAREKDADFTPAQVELSAFAGVSGGCATTGALEWKSTEHHPNFETLAEIGGQMEVQAGAGATAGLYLQFERGKFMFRAKVGAVVGVGFTGGVVVTVGTQQMVTLVQFVYHQLKDNNYGYVDFVDSDTFKALQMKLYEAFLDSGKERFETLMGSFAEIKEHWMTLVDNQRNALELAKNILSDDHGFLPFTSPETKAAMLRQLLLVRYISRNKNGLREIALNKLLRHITCKREYVKVMERLGPNGPFAPVDRQQWSSAQGRHFVIEHLRGDGPAAFEAWFYSLPDNATPHTAMSETIHAAYRRNDPIPFGHFKG